VGFGAEILFILFLGLLVLGPKRLHTVLAEVARAKARFEEASRGFKSQLTAELEAGSQRPGDEEHSPLLATENAIELAHSGLLGRDYEMAEGVTSQRSSPQEIRV
jgi:Sec-independent protein translocase protein TatA